MSDDPELSQRYRELPGEEPPRHLDDAILAASRRAVEARPAPLVVPSGRRRWTFPLAAAAVIVLSISVAVHVEREQPDPEIIASTVKPPESKAAPKPAEVLKAEVKQAPQPQRPAFTPEPQRERATRGELRRERDAAPAARQDAGPAAPAPAAAPLRAQASASGVASESAGKTATLAKLSGESPAQQLERIAELRRLGRHEEADKALAEFRKRYPDYKISEAMLEKVEKRAR